MKFMPWWNQSARAMFRGTMDWFRKLFKNPESVEANAYDNMEREILLSRLESVVRIDPESGEEMDARIMTKIGWLSLVTFKLSVDLRRALKTSQVTAGEDTVINKKQCELLLRKLSELQCTVEVVAKSGTLDGKAESLVEDVRRVVRSAEALIKDCCIPHSSRRLVTAILRVDMKESFSKILYDLQWYRLMLLSTLADTSGESHLMLERAMCTGLSRDCETLLMRAAREDNQSLTDRIQSWNLNDSEQPLADQLLKYLQEQSATEDGEEPSAIFPTPPHFLQVHPKDLKFMGSVIGEGRSLVRSTSWLGSTFAMKECHIGFCGEHTTDCVGQIPDEIAAFRRLGRHPNIVPLLCYAVRGDRYFLVMEQMHTDLGAYLRELKREGVHLSMVSAVGMMLQIAEGMKYIHSKKMAHRDIKSPNILLNLINPDDVRSRICAVKIADFGLTKMKDVTQTHDNQTLGTGTTRWMAPEAYRLAPGSMAKSRLNARKIDVYSFAIVCAEILSLDNPFPNVLNVREHVGAGHRPILPDDCPDKLTTLIKSCWDPRPQERPEFEAICTELRCIKGILLRGLHTSPEMGENQADAVEIEPITTKLIWSLTKSLGWESYLRCKSWEGISRVQMTFSAGLYVLHYVRNFLLLWVYLNLWKTKISSEHPGPFFLYLVFMILGPFLGAVAYKVIVPLEEYPLRSVYIPPFVRLRSFIAGVFKSVCSAWYVAHTTCH
jgi:serine/threonine protein kinase